MCGRGWAVTVVMVTLCNHVIRFLRCIIISECVASLSVAEEKERKRRGREDPSNALRDSPTRERHRETPNTEKSRGDRE